MDWWLETYWRSCGVTVITTPFRYYKWLRLQWESVDVSVVRGWPVACSALSHNLSQLKDRRFETLWRPCCVTVITLLQNAISYYKRLPLKWESVEVCFVISQDMLLNKQSSDWWLETSRRSNGVTVITTPFRYYRWLRLQWESADIFFAISKGILLNNNQAAECLKHREAQVVSLL